MKALILAAGFGTRLLPYTKITPKPLFPISGRPLLDITIRNLHEAGCEAIVVNTHHLHKEIETFISSQKYDVPVTTSYEPEILGTGGAIKSLRDFWNDEPFVVINSDIVTDINLRSVFDFHIRHEHFVTLVMHDYHAFNKVSVGDHDFVIGFNDNDSFPGHKVTKRLAFTGIQVLDPEILEFIPDSVFYSSIDAFRDLLTSGKKIKAFVSTRHYWQDMGTPKAYGDVVFDHVAPIAFKTAFPSCFSEDLSKNPVEKIKLKGDGSDRKWYRLSINDLSLIMADHGIQNQDSVAEIDSFVAIGHHLHAKGAPVPEIHHSDRFSGLAFLEDLGDIDLQKTVSLCKTEIDIISVYKKVIDHLVHLSINCAPGFDASWTYQTPSYSKDLILDKECRYFIEAFINNYLGMHLDFERFYDEFSDLAENVLEHSKNGFMHRDFQSRNIMVKDNCFYFIDFQGGRFGPIQYDLASLLIDPYVNLALPVQEELLDYCFKKYSAIQDISEDKFYSCYKYCALTRNLQMLGAFAFLSRNKGKTYFEAYIPIALKTLKKNLSMVENEFPELASIVSKI